MRVSRVHVRIHACMLALACSAGSVFAQTPPAALADCRAIATSSERLACYDAVSGRAAATRPETPPQPQTPSVPAAPVPVMAGTGAAPKSILDESWDFDPSSPRYNLRFYRANYLLFARYSDSVNNTPFTPLFNAAGQPSLELDSTEVKFQFSFKSRLWTTDDRRLGLWAAYTQQNQWQLYHNDDDVSAPFRETNYMPEVFVSYRPGVELPGGFRWNLVNAGFNHQSNGRAEPLSRSWNRLFAEFGVERDNFALLAKAWYRIKESADNDDNPDITDYLGYGELTGLYRWREHSFLVSGRGNFGTSKGSVHVAWTTPRLLGLFRGYVQFTSGYGESLIDYNHKQTTIGAGIALSDGF